MRIEASGQPGYYFGMGEVQVYSKPRLVSPTLHAVQISTNIRLDYNAPGSAEVGVDAKPASAASNPSWHRYPLNRKRKTVPLHRCHRFIPGGRYALAVDA